MTVLRQLDDKKIQLKLALQLNPCFQHWPESLIDTLAHTAQFIRYFAGQHILQQGQQVVDLVFVLEGVIQSGWLLPDGRHVVNHYLPQDNVINLVPLLDAQGLAHDFFAFGTVTVALLDGKLFLEMLSQKPELLRSILALLCQRTRYLFDELHHKATDDLNHQLARKLHELALRYGEMTLDGVLIGLKLSQEHLAGLLGISRQTLNKELAALTAQNIIGVKYNHILIKDMPKLTAIYA